MVKPDGYRALADPTRRQILRLLRDGELSAGAIADQFDMSWPSVSRHLGLLSTAGLVSAERHGQQIVYSLTTSVLADIVTELAELAGARGSSPSRRTSRRASPLQTRTQS
jgi:ArsR family transcriptional regulator